ncbi:MAG TPA: sigma-70 family RNA polymerase sigma factor [Candidatus Limnocylindria bacterium]|nr:sigma-70 family RNA polymerase sigma factor [Candidatus Limnocylindria bacterium]
MDLASLWSGCKAGDPASRCALIERYSGMAARMARRLHPAGISAVSPEDLESAGLIGLIDAVDRYQPERGVPFEAYAALRVRGAVLDELRAATGGRPSEAPARVSLDELLEAGDHTLPATDEIGPQRAAEDLAARLESALRYLPARQREVIARYYGQSLTLRETGRTMGVSEARASQLHARAIASLRRALLPAAAPRAAGAAA